MSNETNLNLDKPVVCVECGKTIIPVPTGKREDMGGNRFKYEVKCPECGHLYEYVINVTPKSK